MEGVPSGQLLQLSMVYRMIYRLQIVVVALALSYVKLPEGMKPYIIPQSSAT